MGATDLAPGRAIVSSQGPHRGKYLCQGLRQKEAYISFLLSTKSWETFYLARARCYLPLSVLGLVTKRGSFDFQVDSAADRGKSKGGGKMNEEISSDSESER